MFNQVCRIVYTQLNAARQFECIACAFKKRLLMIGVNNTSPATTILQCLKLVNLLNVICSAGDSLSHEIPVEVLFVVWISFPFTPRSGRHVTVTLKTRRSCS